MATAEEIAEVEATLKSVQVAIGRVQVLLADDPGNTGLAATLARLEGQEFELQVRLANLKAAAVTVAGPAAMVGAGPTGSRARAARKTAGKSAKAVAAAKAQARRDAQAFARRALALGTVVLATVGDPKGDAPHRRALKAARGRKR